jgi:integrase
VNSTLTLLRYAAVEGKGWRRGAVILTKNGKLKPDVMTVGGAEVNCPNGRYQMRRYQGKLPVFTQLGNDPTDALNRFRVEESKLNARIAAKAAGLEVVSDDESRKTLKQYAADFLSMHRNLPHRSDDSVRVYTQITSSFLCVCKASYPEQVTKDDVIRWHGWMRREQGYSDRTCSNYYKSLRGFLRYCKLNPGELIPTGTHRLLQAYTKKTPNSYEPEVVQKLIDGSTDHKLLWEFAYKTGLREGELMMLTRYDLCLSGPKPIVQLKERNGLGNIKDLEERGVELHPSLIPKLKAWLEANPKKILLFGTDGDKQDRKMLRALKRDARRAGLNCGHCEGCLSRINECREFTLHRFRRTYVTRMLVATGGDLSTVMKQSGHSDLKSVMRYLAPKSQLTFALAQAF